MKPITTHREILLFKGTGFSNLELSIRGIYNSGPFLPSTGDSVEKAWWAVILDAILPEITIEPSDGHNMYIWNIGSGEHSLLIQQGTGAKPDDAGFSVDPGKILSGIHLN